MEDTLYTMLSRRRQDEISRANIGSREYFREIERLYGDDAFGEITDLWKGARRLFIWRLMDVQDVLSFFRRDVNRGLIVDESGQTLNQFIGMLEWRKDKDGN